MEPAATTNDRLGQLNWGRSQPIEPEAGATGYEMIIQHLQAAGLPTRDFQLVAAIVGYNDYSQEQLVGPVGADFVPELPDREDLRREWGDAVLSDEFDALVSDVDLRALRDVRNAFNAANAQPRQPVTIAAPRVVAPVSAGPGAGNRPVPPGVDNPAPIDSGRLDAEIRAAREASDRLNAEGWAQDIQRELASRRPNEQLLLTRIQQLMHYGSTHEQPNFPGLDLYNAVMGWPPGNPGDPMSYALIARLHEVYDTDDVVLQVAMTYIRNASAAFEAEDYIYFGAVRGFRDGWFAGWGAAERSVEDVYRELQDPAINADVDPRNNIDLVNQRFFIKYGAGDDAEYLPNAPLNMPLRLAGGELPEVRPLAVIADDEFSGEQARMLQAIPYTGRNADGSLQPAYRVAMEIAEGGETAVLDAVERIQPRGVENPMSWDAVETALIQLAASGEFTNDDGPINGQEYPSGRRDENGRNVIGLGALIRSRLSGEALETYERYLSQDGDGRGRFGLDPANLAEYVAQRIYDEELGTFNDDETGALQRYERYIVGQGVTGLSSDGRTTYAEVMAAAERLDLNDDLHRRLAGGTNGTVASTFELLNNGVDPRSGEMRLQRILAEDDRHELRALLYSYDDDEIMAIIEAAADSDLDAADVIGRIGTVERAVTLNPDAPEGSRVPTPSVARILLAMENAAGNSEEEVERSPEAELLGHYHPSIFLRDADGNAIAVNPAVNFATAFHYSATRPATMRQLVDEIPFDARQQVQDAFVALDEAMGDGGRSLADAFRERYGENGLYDLIAPQLEPLTVDRAASFEDNFAVLREALHVEARGMARLFTHEHGIVDVRMRELEVDLERILRHAQERTNVDPSQAGLNEAEVAELTDAIYGAMRASLNTREEIEEFDRVWRERTVMLVGIAAAVVTMPLSAPVALGTTTLRVGSLAIPHVPTVSAQAVRTVAMNFAQRAPIAAGAAVAGGIAADFALDGEHDMTLRDYGQNVAIGFGSTLMMSRLPGVTLAEVRWGARSWAGLAKVSGNFAVTGGLGYGSIEASGAAFDGRPIGEVGEAFVDGAFTGALWSAVGAAAFSGTGFALVRAAERYPWVTTAFGVRHAHAFLAGTDDAVLATPGGAALLGRETVRAEAQAGAAQGGAAAVREGTEQTGDAGASGATGALDDAGKGARPDSPSAGQAAPVREQTGFEDMALENLEAVLVTNDRYHRALLRSGAGSSDDLARQADQELFDAITSEARGANLTRRQQAIAGRWLQEGIRATTGAIDGTNAFHLHAALRELVQLRTLGVRTPSRPVWNDVRRMMQRLYPDSGLVDRTSLRDWAMGRLNTTVPNFSSDLLSHLARANSLDVLEFMIATQLRTRQGLAVTNTRMVAEMGAEAFEGITEAGMRNTLSSSFGPAGPTASQSLDDWLNSARIQTHVGRQELTTQQRVMLALEMMGGELDDWTARAIRHMRNNSDVAPSPAPAAAAADDVQPAPAAAAADDVQPAPVAAADDVQLAPAAAADDVQPAPAAAADDVQPAPAAAADDVQPAPVAAADDVQPAPVAAADDVQPAPVAAADDVQPAPVAAADD
ncbi:MAG: hypothetical protein AAF654_05485, partial [Myxococcota bacterium]